MSAPLRILAGLVAAGVSLHAAAPQFRITVEPTDVERAGLIVTFTLPAEFDDGAILRNDAGQVVPLQPEPDRSASFIVGRQPAQTPLHYTLEAGTDPGQREVQVVSEPTPVQPGMSAGDAIAAAANRSRASPQAGRLRISVGGRPLFYYQMDSRAAPRGDIDPAFRRGGYLHPVLTPNGRVVTGDYPLDHPEQHGVSTLPPTLEYGGHQVRFANPGTDSGRVEFGDVDNTWGGPVSGGFSVWQRWVDTSLPNSVTLINETWDVTAYALPSDLDGINLFDLVVRATNATEEDLFFSPRAFSGLAVRGTEAWPAGERTVLRSDPAGSRWAGFTGPDGFSNSAIVVLLPPADTGSPPGPSRVDGLAPYLELQNGTNRDRLTPGSTIGFRQRIATFDRSPDPALLQALWNGYVRPAQVTLTPLGDKNL